MKTITFTCETITPMFLSGADQRVPELRPPSIKGALRFWWRAMNGHLSLEELKQKKARFLGGLNLLRGVRW
ncbi:type III-B CRISPR module RAMP protein Cmr1 [Thermaurantimonas aggregans]|uniref:type III-B CRISPR module RAMP protein Cmr1 n=1 Tax=Thermaurantimonas aggregans TaxID=2173829 RepID=UPI000F588BE9|nr:type III-B CRISPR module RAMP protein Cmr1 [Thermaurantimonas aggregans]